jgi:peptide methionine sulfoxide reductase msrA/msrB
MAWDNVKKLTVEEERVIVHKGTERPYSGKYNDHKEKGLYTCKRCGKALYRSEDKFSSGCGWPSFDDELPEAVRRERDADGHRVEILCQNCGGHLGHVFEGEGFTAKNTRHCVNSISMDFVPTDQIEAAYFAGGCFWGVEYFFDQAKGVLYADSGYMGGHKDNPTYKEVCYTDTGHLEVVKVVYDKRQTDFKTLAKLFFETHDPFQTNGQGPDIGSQYLSAVFVNNEEEKKITEALISELEKEGGKVATTIRDMAPFYRAEEYHQNYYFKTGKKPYCHTYIKKFK